MHKGMAHTVSRWLEWDGIDATATYALLQSAAGADGTLDLEPHISIAMGSRRRAVQPHDPVVIRGTVLTY